MALCDSSLPSVLLSILPGTSFSPPAKSTKLATPTAVTASTVVLWPGPLTCPVTFAFLDPVYTGSKDANSYPIWSFLPSQCWPPSASVGKGSPDQPSLVCPACLLLPYPCCVLCHPENHDSDREHTKKASDDPQNSDRFGEKLFKLPVEIQKQPASLPFSPISTSLGWRAAYRQKMEDNFDSSRKEEIRT